MSMADKGLSLAAIAMAAANSGGGGGGTSYTAGEGIIINDDDEIRVDFNTVATNEHVDTELADKQDTLTAGDNITIENNVISATGGSSYTAGDDIKIEENEISTIYGQATVVTDIVNEYAYFFNSFSMEAAGRLDTIPILTIDKDYTITITVTGGNFPGVYTGTFTCEQDQDNYKFKIADISSDPDFDEVRIGRGCWEQNNVYYDWVIIHFGNWENVTQVHLSIVDPDAPSLITMDSDNVPDGTYVLKCDVDGLGMKEFYWDKG